MDHTSDGEQFDPVAATADMRSRLVDLGSTIESLRDEADALLERAASRAAIAVLEHPPERDLDELEASFEAASAAIAVEHAEPMPLSYTGRHAVEQPEDFDPRPYDPEADAGQDGEAVDAEVPAFQDLAAAPAFEALNDMDGGLPAFDAGSTATPLEPSAHHAVLGEPAEDVASDAAEAEGDHVAEVIAFTPRTDDDAPAFGSLVEDLDGPVQSVVDAHPAQGEPGSQPIQQESVLPADVEEAFTELPDPPKSRSDDLDTIAGTSATDPPADWNTPHEDDEAFDKFFSAEVEPEPAQRWLLNE